MTENTQNEQNEQNEQKEQPEVKGEQANHEDKAREAEQQRRAASELDSLRDSVNRLEAKNRELLEEKSKAKQAAEQAALEAAKKTGDLDALEASWNQKLDANRSEAEKRIHELEGMVTRITSGAAAKSMASDLALPGHSDVLLPHIERRLSTEVRDGEPRVRVLTAEGKPSAMSMEDLRKEVASNPMFAPILAGSRATGAGQPGAQGGGTKPSNKKFAEYSGTELVALRRENPTEYDRLKAQHHNRG